MKGFFVRIIMVLLLVIIVNHTVTAQSSIKDSTINMSLITVNTSMQLPMGDLNDRFGYSTMLGLSYGYKTQSNWTFSVEGGFFFGNNVKVNVAEDIRTKEGYILDVEGNYVDMLVLERGQMFAVSLAKTLPVVGPNLNSGLLLRGGVGLLQHKIRIETRKNDVPILEGEYLKGFDRLTNGLMVQVFAGYQHLSNNRRVNYTVGLEWLQGFTESRRNYNFDLRARDTQMRNDALLGLKLSWSFLIYKQAAGKLYFK